MSFVGPASTGDIVVLISERRRVRRLRHYWDRLRRGRAMPAMHDVDPRALPVAWSDCFVLATAEDAREPTFVHVGNALTVDCGRRLSGEALSAVPATTLIDKATRGVAEVLATRAPLIVEGEFVHADGDTVLYRAIMLPFADDAEHVDHLLGAATCRRLTPG